MTCNLWRYLSLIFEVVNFKINFLLIFLYIVRKGTLKKSIPKREINNFEKTNLQVDCLLWNCRWCRISISVLGYPAFKMVVRFSWVNFAIDICRDAPFLSVKCSMTQFSVSSFFGRPVWGWFPFLFVNFRTEVVVAER